MEETPGNSPSPERPFGVWRRWIAAGLAAAVLAAIAVTALRTDTSGEPISLSEATRDVRGGSVTALVVDDTSRTATLTYDSGGDERSTVFPDGYGPELSKLALRSGVEVTARAAAPPPLYVQLLFDLLPVVVIGALLYVLVTKKMPGAVRIRTEAAAVPTTRFTDLAGCDEAVNELAEIARFLHEPERFVAAGARLPRGALLEGPPGTGKTLLARAVAGEAGVPFFALSGSDFVETFVGMGAARVRRVFAAARKHGRAIIFIDEIDALGRARSSGPGNGATDEREHTLNQLLVEMDGFHTSGVIVVAATNRADLLDAALTRPGRFDRRIVVPAPDRAGRERILRLHAEDRSLAGDVDFTGLSRRTPGMTGADLASLVNTAALLAARRGDTVVSAADLDQALATTMLGPERRSAVMTDRDRTVTAWHEAGHTVAALVTDDADDPVQVTIIPRGPAGGVTWMSGNDNSFLTRREAEAKLVVTMAGRAAEELLLGGDYTQGAAGDFSSATDLALKMVTQYGMSDLGVTFLHPEQLAHGAHADRVHEVVARLLDEALAQARALLRRHRLLLERVAAELAEAETLDLADLRRISGGLAHTADSGAA